MTQTVNHVSFTASDSMGRANSSPSASPANGRAAVACRELGHRARVMCAVRLRNASSALLCLLVAIADEDRTCS